MIYAPFRYVFTGIVIGFILANVSGDYILVSRRKYEKLKRKYKDTNRED
ncbi:MAG: hypothetical protein ACNA7U_01265 [Candidatus Izemoplasmataceae bacterium]